MATATVHKLPATEQFDPHSRVEQASGLLFMLLRTFSGEVDEEDRASSADVLNAFDMTCNALADSIGARTENLEQGATILTDGARKALSLALSSLRLIKTASFFLRTDQSGDAEEVAQGAGDSVLANSLWAVHELVNKVEKRLQ